MFCNLQVLKKLKYVIERKFLRLDHFTDNYLLTIIITSLCKETARKKIKDKHAFR